MSIPLDVFAQLSLVADTGEEVAVSAKDETITVELPSLWTGRSIVARQLADRAQRKRMIEKLHMGLQVADLALEFWVAHRLIAQLRPQSRPTLLSRILGVGAVELRIIPLLLSLLRR